MTIRGLERGCASSWPASPCGERVSMMAKKMSTLTAPT